MDIKYPKCHKKEYPRPLLVRESFTSLNGEWDFNFDKDGDGEFKGYTKGFLGDYKINVPFAYQTKRSGIDIQTRCDTVWYSRFVTLKKLQQDKRLLLHFEGCDYLTRVWVNGAYCGEHTGAYERFSFDITPFIKEGENNITVRAEDSYSCRRPRGKQRWRDESFACFYVDTTGIWKTVWLEEVSAIRFGSVKIMPDLDKLSVSFECEIQGFKPSSNLDVNVSIGIDDLKVFEGSARVTDDVFRFTAPLQSDAGIYKFRDWYIGRQNCLYDVELVLSDNGKETDRVGSYFGLRKWGYQANSLTLNGNPLYLKMLLDQGYWPDSGLTPPDEDAILKDVLLTKEAGFNGIRKHQKIEDDRFYYYCDILGVAVWCEMPSGYEFSQGFKTIFASEFTGVIKQHEGFASIMAWVPLNESWGVRQIKSDRDQQAFADAMYYLAKALDPTRLVISNDGWEHTTSDIITLHNYAQDPVIFKNNYLDLLDSVLKNKQLLHPSHLWHQAFADGYEYKGQPIMISEYAGIAFKRDKEKGWGYGEGVDNEEEFITRLEKLTDAIRSVPEICGYCITQTTDVEQEVNGLLTVDRQWKVDVKKIQEINR